jgi:hypothetical protein
MSDRCRVCGASRMAGRRLCAACYNEARRQRYASPSPQTRHHPRWPPAPGRAWCWWCQASHPLAAFARHRGRASGVQPLCREGARTLYRVRTTGTTRCPARGTRRRAAEAPCARP